MSGFNTSHGEGNGEGDGNNRGLGCGTGSGAGFRTGSGDGSGNGSVSGRENGSGDGQGYGDGSGYTSVLYGTYLTEYGKITHEVRCCELYKYTNITLCGLCMFDFEQWRCLPKQCSRYYSLNNTNCIACLVEGMK